MKAESTDSIDSYLIAINIATLAGFFFIFQSTINNTLVKWSLLVAFVLFVLSLCLLLWHKFRYPKRVELANSLREKTVNKFTERIASFIEDIAVPFSRLKTRDETLDKLSKAKSQKEFDQVKAGIAQEIKDLESGKVKGQGIAEEKATRFIVESFLGHMGSETKDDYNKAFKQPLKESHAKIKYYLDRAALKFRRHLFAGASVFIIFSVLIQILDQ